LRLPAGASCFPSFTFSPDDKGLARIGLRAAPLLSLNHGQDLPYVWAKFADGAESGAVIMR
jgi:hypothetical protein